MAVLQDVPPEYLEEQGQFVDPGWQQIEEQLRRALRPDKLQALQVEIASCQLFIRVFLARKAVIDVFSQELGLDLVIPPIRDREQAIGDLLAIYSQQAARSWESEPDEDGFVPPDEVLPFPSDLRLPLIDVGKLEPDPADVELMRQSLGTPLVDDWWQAADELGICGALGDWIRTVRSVCGDVAGSSARSTLPLTKSSRRHFMLTTQLIPSSPAQRLPKPVAVAVAPGKPFGALLAEARTG